MANVSSVSGLSSLSEDLYYQYLINHNSTSTMLNAISGNSDDSDTSGLMGAVSSGMGIGNGVGVGLLSAMGQGNDASALSLISSLTGLGGFSGEDGLLSASQGLANFSNILETYLNAQRSQAAQMTESLSAVLEEAAQTEDTSSLTYRTVQDIYDYFLEQSGANSAGDAVADQTASATSSQRQAQRVGAVLEEVDFESLIEAQRQAMEARQQEMEARLGVNPY